MNRFTYYKVIQGNYGFGWDDEDFHQTNSQGAFENKEAREAFRYNLKAYRENGGGAYRVIRRREVENPAPTEKCACDECRAYRRREVER